MEQTKENKMGTMPVKKKKKKMDKIPKKKAV